MEFIKRYNKYYNKKEGNTMLIIPLAIKKEVDAAIIQFAANIQNNNKEIGENYLTIPALKVINNEKRKEVLQFFQTNLPDFALKNLSYLELSDEQLKEYKQKNINNIKYELNDKQLYDIYLSVKEVMQEILPKNKEEINNKLHQKYNEIQTKTIGPVIERLSSTVRTMNILNEIHRKSFSNNVEILKSLQNLTELTHEQLIIMQPFLMTSHHITPLLRDYNKLLLNVEKLNDNNKKALNEPMNNNKSLNIIDVKAIVDEKIATTKKELENNTYNKPAEHINIENLLHRSAKAIKELEIYKINMELKINDGNSKVAQVVNSVKSKLKMS